MSSAPDTVPMADDVGSPLADPALRLAARTIDAVLPLVPAFLLVPAGVMLGAPALIRAGFAASIVVMLALGAWNLFWLHRYGQTVGKRMLGLRIVGSDGQRATLGTIFWRRIVLTGVLGAVPLVGWLFALADALCVFSATRRTLHDHLAGTIVVDVRCAMSAEPEELARTFE